MLSKSCSIAKMMGCCSCFGFTRKRKPAKPSSGFNNRLSQELLLEGGGDTEDDDNCSSNDDLINSDHCEESEPQTRTKRSEDILHIRAENGMICRQCPVKETHRLVRAEDEYGNKTINEYVRECKIGAGSYGKVVLYRSRVDGKHYAIKAFHKSHLLKLRVAPSETAMTDVYREVLIMKMLNHPNIVNLVEVIDDPETDHFYMVLEYVEGKWVCEGSGPASGLGESTARKYLRDIVSGLIFWFGFGSKPEMESAAGLVAFPLLIIFKTNSGKKKIYTYYWIEAEIILKNINQYFYYMSCDFCNKKLMFYNDNEETDCENPKCGKRCLPTPRARAYVQLDDGTELLDAVMFGDVAENIFSCTAVQLRSYSDEKHKLFVQKTTRQLSAKKWRIQLYVDANRTMSSKYNQFTIQAVEPMED
ncbi:hypothetical protein CsatA_000859 [Cannabis sativa]